MIRLRRSDMSEKDIERFFAKVDKSGDCWLWQGCVHHSNAGNVYGIIGFAGTSVLVHRFAYAIAYGECPANLVVDHRCRNPRCVNPDHLQAVTQQQNCENRPANKSNKTGVRGLTWDKQNKKYLVRVISHGKLHYGGEYVDIREAERTAIALRNRLMSNNLEDR